MACLVATSGSCSKRYLNTLMRHAPSSLRGGGSGSERGDYMDCPNAPRDSAETEMVVTLDFSDKVREAPWVQRFHGIIQRCKNPRCSNYHRYGGRGIKCLITVEEIKQLWFRDKAYLLTRPSIDRINNDGNYTLKNCRFIESGENSSRASWIDASCKKGHGDEYISYKSHGEKGVVKYCLMCRRITYLKHKSDPRYKASVASCSMRYYRKKVSINDGSCRKCTDKAESGYASCAYHLAKDRATWRKRFAKEALAKVKENVE